MTVWVLGATGRVGQSVAARLHARGHALALVGRDAERLQRIGAQLGGPPVVTAATTDDLVEEIGRRRPAVVVNTIGDYAATAVRIARACLPGGHYVDVANDLVALPRLLALDEEAAAAGGTLVTAAGFGALATEAVVVALCTDRPRPAQVHVDALSSVGSAAGPVGEALAASVVDVLTTGGRRVADGRLVPARLGSGQRRITLPDGATVRSGALPTGELLVAQRASGAPSVTVTAAHAPTGPLARAALPLVGRLLSVPAVRRFAVRRMAGTSVKAAPPPRQHSWGHAVVTWPDGTRREGWLRAGDAMDFTASAVAETAVRLAAGEGEPGASTPAALFGAELAVAAGGTLLLD